MVNGPSGGTAFSASSASAFNTQASTLQKRLNDQSGGSVQLVIANAIWTRNIAVRQSYADDMKAQFNVGLYVLGVRVEVGAAGSSCAIHGASRGQVLRSMISRCWAFACGLLWPV